MMIKVVKNELIHSHFATCREYEDVINVKRRLKFHFFKIKLQLRKIENLLSLFVYFLSLSISYVCLYIIVRGICGSAKSSLFLIEEEKSKVAISNFIPLFLVGSCFAQFSSDTSRTLSLHLPLHN